MHEYYVNKAKPRAAINKAATRVRVSRPKKTKLWSHLKSKLVTCLDRFPTDNPVTVDQLVAKYDANEGRCAMSGVAMTWAVPMSNTTMSVDKIDPLLGYTDNNTQLICLGLNSMKGRQTMDETLKLARAYVLFQDKKAAEALEFESESQFSGPGG